MPSENSSPALRLDSRRRRSPPSLTVLPLTLVMTSPALTPALAAAESVSTEDTSTPSLAPKYSPSCGDRSSIDTPRRLPPKLHVKCSSAGGTGVRGGDGGRGGTAWTCGAGVGRWRKK